MRIKPLITLPLLLLSIAACNPQNSAPEPNPESKPEPIGKANPAAVFCIEKSGEYDLENGTCKLPDGTIVDAWKFLREHQKAN